MARVDSQGLYLQAGDGASPETFTTIGEICDMPPFVANKNLRDQTCLDSTVREYGAGLFDPPSVSLTMFWDPDDAQQTALYTAYTDEAADNYRVLCPDSPATTWSFSAKIIGFTTPYAGVDADIQWDVTFQLTSTITKA